MSPELLLIPVLLPVTGGTVMLLMPSGSDRTPDVQEERRRNLYTEIIACLTSCLVVLFLTTVRGHGNAVYSFADSFSIAFLVDGPSMLFAGMLALMWPFVLLYAFDYMRGARHGRRFFAFYLMTYGVTLGVAFAANLVTMYVFFEMLTLVTIPLVSQNQDPESVYASRLYTAYCIAGASLAFVAVVMGTLDGIGEFLYGGNLAGRFDPSLMRIIYLFGFFGFGAKAAVFPLFVWLPRASVAPTPVTALLHAVAVVNTGAYAVMRLTWYAFGRGLLVNTPVQNVCILTAAFTMTFAAVMALKQRHFKRRLAYSTMSNLSYILFGISLLTPEGFHGALAHMLFHGVIKMTLFLCAGAFMHKTGHEYLYEVNGAGAVMPYTFTAYTLGAMSLTGIPLFCGFVSKWTLLSAGLGAGGTAALIGTLALIVSAFLCAIYTLTVSIRAFFASETLYAPGIREADWRMLTPIWFFTAVNFYFGMFPGAIMDFLSRIANGLM